VGAYLAQRDVPPSYVLCSSARRATETLDHVLAELSERPEVHTARDLYHAGPGELLDQIREVGDDVAALLLVGHNPGVEDLALALAGSGDGRARRRMQSKYPTAGLAEIHFDCDRWRQVEFRGGKLRGFRTPKDLV